VKRKTSKKNLRIDTRNIGPEERLKLIFSNVKEGLKINILLLFFNNAGYCDNISGLKEILDTSHPTMRGHTKDLIKAGILKELYTGRNGKILMINEESLYVPPVRDLLERIEEPKDTILKKIFSTNASIGCIILFKNGDRYFNNISGIARALGISYLTAQKTVRNLISVGLLKEHKIGKSILVEANEESIHMSLFGKLIESFKDIQEREASIIKY